ncbi:MAG TPA: PAS domain-containing protein [Bacteroidales bacterium]|nr:PAS domain-containing protein [Bacteroidales bacterium]
MQKRFLQSTLNLKSKNSAEKARNPAASEYFLNLYEQIIQNSRDVLYCLNYVDFEIEYLSPSIVDLTGYSIDEIMQLPRNEFINIIHPEDKEGFLMHFQSIKNNSSKKNLSFEYRIKPKRGINRWVNDSHILIFDPFDRSEKIIGNIHDITDLKLVENALKRSRERLYMAIEATNDGMWDWRLDTNQIFFDLRFYTMMGYELYEFPGSYDEWMKRIHPDDLESVQDQLQKHLKGQSDQWNIEYRFKARDGNWVWVLNRGKVFERDDNDKPLRMVGTHTDISLMKEVEMALKQKNEDLVIAEGNINKANTALTEVNIALQQQNKELERIFNQLQVSEERFRQLAENTEDIFWLSDDKSILYMNPAFEKVWGRSRTEIIENPTLLECWIHPDDKQRYRPWFDISTIEHQSACLEQYRIITPSGEIRWLWSRRFPVYDSNGKLYRVAGIASDITAQKRTEEALITAKEKALESDKLKSAFLANISHEIRTPMNGILGFAELLKEHKQPDTQEQFIDIITQSSTRLLHIIEDIVDISKLEAGQLQLKKDAVLLRNLLHDIFNIFRKQQEFLGKEYIKFYADIEISNSETYVLTDGDRLKQVLSNLLSNAFKFTDSGFVKFGYRIIEKETIEFYVQDTGIGIPHEFQNQLFKRFQQVDNSNSRKFGGTGLGLAICEGIVKLLGGRIWLTSEKNKGTTFYFTIPFVEPAIQSLPVQSNAVSEKTMDWSSKTILIVEDDLINLEYFKVLLYSTSINLISASTGEDAVSICTENQNIDLVLMDLRLPQMSGYEAFEKIRQMRPKLPLIAQSAFAMAEDAAQCLNFGFSDFIAKPINKNTFFNIVRKYLA